MTTPTFTGFLAGTLQFIVALYALRLNRLFGTVRVGWSLCCAFALLALLHLAQLLKPVHTMVSLEAEVEVVYALISVLLLTGMIHLESLLKERKKIEQKEQQLRTELELEVKKKTEYLTRAIEGLQAEIDERKRMETVVQTTDFELRAVSRQIELAKTANSVLHCAGPLLDDALQTASRVTSQLQQSQTISLPRMGSLIREHGAKAKQFNTLQPDRQHFAAQVARWAEQLIAEQKQVLHELRSVQINLGNIATMQQNYVRLADSSPTPVAEQYASPAGHALAI